MSFAEKIKKQVSKYQEAYARDRRIAAHERELKEEKERPIKEAYERVKQEEAIKTAKYRAEQECDSLRSSATINCVRHSCWYAVGDNSGHGRRRDEGHWRSDCTCYQDRQRV